MERNWQKKYSKRGKLSLAPSRHGHVAKGYRRIWDREEKRFRMDHRVVWIAVNGAIPKRLQIHHKDLNKLNNCIENLELVSSLTQKRIHSGCQIRDGKWWKPCRGCGILQPIDNFYKRKKNGVCSWCKKCEAKRVAENRRKRRQCGEPLVCGSPYWNDPKFSKT